jgi:hypothetical protein
MDSRRTTPISTTAGTTPQTAQSPAVTHGNLWKPVVTNFEFFKPGKAPQGWAMLGKAKHFLAAPNNGKEPATLNAAFLFNGSPPRHPTVIGPCPTVSD